MIDKATFTANYEIFDKEIVKEIIEIYIQEYPDRITNLQKNIDERDLESLYKNAHSLKGVTANFFDKDTEDLARQLETKGKEGDESGIEDLFKRLKTTSEKLVAELKELIKEYS